MNRQKLMDLNPIPMQDPIQKGGSSSYLLALFCVAMTIAFLAIDTSCK